MNKKLLSALAIIGISLGANSIASATNTFTLADPNEITDFPSGYDIASVDFTLNNDDSMTIELFPYGVPGDADGDGNPDTATNGVPDYPGVGIGELLVLGLECGGGTSCVPNLTVRYTNNTMIVEPAAAAPYISFAMSADRYTFTINSLSTVRQIVLGYVPPVVQFGTFSITASILDRQVDDFVPDRNADGSISCQQVTLELPPVESPGTGTIGYWKNHPSEWPAGCDLTLPGSDSDPAAFAMNILEAPVRGDKTISLAKQLVAAKLNDCIGNDTSCIDQTMLDAEDWLYYHPVFSGQKQWEGGDIHQETLDDYNNGLLCAPHRD